MTHPFTLSTSITLSALALTGLLAGCGTTTTKQPVTIQPQAVQQGLIIVSGPCPAGTSERYEIPVLSRGFGGASVDPNYSLIACG